MDLVTFQLCWIACYRKLSKELTNPLNNRDLYLHILEAHSHYKVGSPVGETSYSNGRRSGTLREQLSHNEPWDRTRSNFKECHKRENGHDAQIWHPFELVLWKWWRLVTEEISSPTALHGKISCVRMWAFTSRAKAIVIKMADPAIPSRPIRCSDLRPARSTTNSYHEKQEWGKKGNEALQGNPKYFNKALYSLL